MITQATSIGKVKLDDCDLMIQSLLQNKATLNAFINASVKDGVPNTQVQKQLKYFCVKTLIN